MSKIQFAQSYTHTYIYIHTYIHALIHSLPKTEREEAVARPKKNEGDQAHEWSRELNEVRGHSLSFLFDI